MTIEIKTEMITRLRDRLRESGARPSMVLSAAYETLASPDAQADILDSQRFNGSPHGILGCGCRNRCGGCSCDRRSRNVLGLLNFFHKGLGKGTDKTQRACERAP